MFKYSWRSSSLSFFLLHVHEWFRYFSNQRSRDVSWYVYFLFTKHVLIVKPAIVWLHFRKSCDFEMTFQLFASCYFCFVVFVFGICASLIYNVRYCVSHVSETIVFDLTVELWESWSLICDRQFFERLLRKFVGTGGDKVSILILKFTICNGQAR